MFSAVIICIMDFFKIQFMIIIIIKKKIKMFVCVCGGGGCNYKLKCILRCSVFFVHLKKYESLVVS